MWLSSSLLIIPLTQQQQKASLDYYIYFKEEKELERTSRVSAWGGGRLEPASSWSQGVARGGLFLLFHGYSRQSPVRANYLQMNLHCEKPQAARFG